MASRGRGPFLIRHASKAVSSSELVNPTPNAVPRTHFVKTFKFGDDVPDPRKKGSTGYYTKSFRYGDAAQNGVQTGPRRTIFTSPGATKSSVLDLVRNSSQLPPREASGGERENNAVVILASPRHASWLTDADFMASLVSSLLAHRGPDHAAGRFHMLAAVVDGLCPKPSTFHHKTQEGLSIQFGGLDTLLPGLWNETTDAVPPAQASAEPSYLSVSLQKRGLEDDRMSVTLPLANTLFHNGRRSTLLASEWTVEDRGGSSSGPPARLFRMAEKGSQTIDLPISLDSPKYTIRSPLVPITHPRLILEGLGNILAKVNIDGEPSPASRELQSNIPRLIEARRSSVDPESPPGRIGVWALIIPGGHITPKGGALKAPPEAMADAVRRLRRGAGFHRLGMAAEKLAFELSSADQRTAWGKHPVLGAMLLKGAHLHRIMSGGGEWGAKASLLSLDPQTSYGLESEQDELLRFQRSFYGNEEAGDAIAPTGDFVQFFVDGDTSSTHTPDKSWEHSRSPAIYPPVIFGVGDLSQADAPPHDELAPAEGEPASLAPGHFGGFSAEGLYVYSPANRLKTKLDAPGTSVGLLQQYLDESFGPRLRSIEPRAASPTELGRSVHPKRRDLSSWSQ